MDNADFNATAITTLMDENHATFADAVAHISQYVAIAVLLEVTNTRHASASTQT